jgi:hypothetical protein
MPGIHELRAELASRKREKSGMAGTIAGVLAAFVVGGLLVFGWQFIPSAMLNGGVSGSAAPRQAAVTIATSGNRLGRAATAPLLKGCLTRVLDTGNALSSYRRAASGLRDRPRGFPRDEDFAGLEAGALYAMLEAGKTLSLASSLLGDPAGAELNVQLATMWGQLAECVYNQDAPALCDADNRALAVDSLTTHLRQSKRALADAAKAPADMQHTQLRSLGERVVGALRHHLRDGALIGADFGMFPPDEIKRAASEVKPIRDVCAARK